MAEATPERMVVCRAGGERFALPVPLVREVVALPPLTRIPGAPPAVRGLANVHGMLVTVLSGSPPAEQPSNGAAEWLVVLTARQGRVGLAVEEVEDLSTASAAAVRVADVEGLVRSMMGG